MFTPTVNDKLTKYDWIKYIPSYLTSFEGNPVHIWWALENWRLERRHWNNTLIFNAVTQQIVFLVTFWNHFLSEMGLFPLHNYGVSYYLNYLNAYFEYKSRLPIPEISGSNCMYYITEITDRLECKCIG